MTYREEQRKVQTMRKREGLKKEENIFTRESERYVCVCVCDCVYVCVCAHTRERKWKLKRK